MTLLYHCSRCAELACSSRVQLAVPTFLQTDLKRGLSTQLVEERRAVWGYNQLEEKKVNPFLLFLGYFWGPMPVSSREGSGARQM